MHSKASDNTNLKANLYSNKKKKQVEPFAGFGIAVRHYRDIHN